MANLFSFFIFRNTMSSHRFIHKKIQYINLFLMLLLLAILFMKFIIIIIQANVLNIGGEIEKEIRRKTEMNPIDNNIGKRQKNFYF